jgi:uncharacterized membrane protein
MIALEDCGCREAIDADAVHTVQLRFRLDLSQLPRPLQIGAWAARAGVSGHPQPAAGARGGAVIRAATPPTCRRARIAQALARQSRAVRWAVGVGAAIMSAIGLVLLFHAHPGHQQPGAVRAQLRVAVWRQCAGGVLLLAVLVWVGVRLVVRLAAGALWQPSAGQAGRHFCAGGLMPGLLIYVVSYQFVTRSIESWFDVKVEGALVAGVNLARVSRWIPWPKTWPPRRAPPVPAGPGARRRRRLVLERIRDQLSAPAMWCCGMRGQRRCQCRAVALQPQPGAPHAAAVAHGAPAAHPDPDRGAGRPHRHGRYADARMKAFALVASPRVGLLLSPGFCRSRCHCPRPGGQRHRGARGQP